MALSDFWVLVLKGTNGAVPTVNVFQYMCNEPFNATVEAAEELINAFILGVINSGDDDDLNGSLFTTGQAWTEIEAYNLDEPTAFETRSIAYTGSLVAEQLPRYSCYGFATDRQRRDIKRGHKRFSGVPETHSNAGLIPTAIFDRLVILGQKLATTIDDGEVGALTFSPAVVKRVPYVTSTGTNAYRFPEPGDPLAWFLPNEFVPYPNISSQVTRKRLS